MANGNSVFGSIKSKLGLGGNQEYDEYDSYDDYDDGYDGYDSYDQATSDYDEYDPYADSTAPRSFGNRNTVTTRNVRGGSHARLVSTADAQTAARNSRDYLGGASSYNGGSLSTRSSGGRTMVDSSLPSVMTPEGTAALAEESNRRASGLDSLFSSTSPEPEREEVEMEPGSGRSDSRASRAFSAGNVNAERASHGYSSSSASSDGDESKSVGASSFGRRKLQIIRPVSYNDAESVAQALKAGEVAVLVMRETKSDLVKRILDFSFGVACALGANVETPAKGVYAIAIGAALSESEKTELSSRGAF